MSVKKTMARSAIVGALGFSANTASSNPEGYR